MRCVPEVRNEHLPLINGSAVQPFQVRIWYRSTSILCKCLNVVLNLPTKLVFHHMQAAQVSEPSNHARMDGLHGCTHTSHLNRVGTPVSVQGPNTFNSLCKIEVSETSIGCPHSPDNWPANVKARMAQGCMRRYLECRCIRELTPSPPIQSANYAPRCIAANEEDEGIGSTCSAGAGVCGHPREAR